MFIEIRSESHNALLFFRCCDVKSDEAIGPVEW